MKHKKRKSTDLLKQSIIDFLIGFLLILIDKAISK